MPRLRSADLRTARTAWTRFRRLPANAQVVLAGVLVIGGLLYLAATYRRTSAAAPDPAPAEAEAAPGDGVLFAFWNVENLFDDRLDPGRRSVDQEFNRGFAEDDALRALKLDRLATAVLRLNNGRGPDLLAFAEVESVRAADLLREALNDKLRTAGRDPKLLYTQLAMKDLGNDAGRHIGTGLIGRLPVAHPRTRLLGHNLRILEVRVQAAGHDLTVVVSHWTSQLRQRDGSDGDAGRDKYARTIYENYRRAAEANPRVDYLVCGDFNCEPADSSVTDVLGAFGDRSKLAGRPAFLNLLANKPASDFGTIFYAGKPLVYDHICVSPGLLDAAGWGCEPGSVRAAADGLIRPGATRREPWRFGDPGRVPPGGRGWSDHFPVTVRLTVRP